MSETTKRTGTRAARPSRGKAAGRAPVKPADDLESAAADTAAKTAKPAKPAKPRRVKTADSAAPGASKPAPGPADPPNAGPSDGRPAQSRDPLAALMQVQADATQTLLSGFGAWPSPTELASQSAIPPAWRDMASSLTGLWQQFPAAEYASLGSPAGPLLADPGPWRTLVEGWYRQVPLLDEDARERFLADGVQLWETILGQYGIGEAAGRDVPTLPRQDRRFADPRWRDQPVFALLHQAYLLLAEQLSGMVDRAEGLDPARKAQLTFATRAMIDALSPANFPLTNPVALERLVETRGESLLAGLRHVLADLERGQLTQSDPAAFVVGRDLATTPGVVIHETPLYQLIQYSPSTASVLETPLVIFPPWINRFYILDLTPQKSFVRWAVEQGLTVLMVSWKSADASIAETTWDDYIAAQVEAIDVARARFDVPAVHTIGYCVAGTALAATLAVLARRGKAAKVASATFFTAQVDFEQAGELLNFIDDAQIALLAGLAKDGCIDGRYLASAFNLLRGQDLIWNYVVNNYLLGEDYRAFDLLHWNGDPANVPAGWHQAYLRDLYRDNLLVQPDRLSACGVPIDLRRITTPCFIQAGREDHIAPPQSVWRLTRHVSGPWTFLLAGSGHIAGVVNPPAAGKYQYWTNSARAETLEDFVATAQEHPGSWWPYWLEWIRAKGAHQVPATGRRAPGSPGDEGIEPAPGRYVVQR